MYLGRYQLGAEVPLQLQCVDENEEAVVPDACPAADVYTLDGMDLVKTVRPAPMERFKRDGLFGMLLRLGPEFTTGNFTVVFRWAVDSQQFQRVDTFEVDPGGDADGYVVSLREYRRPSATHLVQQRTAGKLCIGRNPQVT